MFGRKHFATALASTALVAGLSLVTGPSASATSVSDAATAGKANAAADCPRGYLCLYSEKNFGGSMYSAYRCGIIYNVGLDWGSDRVRSYWNNQTGNVTAVFYNWDGARWVPIGTSKAPEMRTQAPPIFYSVPGGVDGVKAC